MIASVTKILFGVTEILFILFVVMATWAYSFVKSQNYTLKSGHIIICIAYFNKVFF